MTLKSLLDQFHSREPREKLLLVCSGLILVVLAVYLFAVQPLFTALSDTRARVDGNAQSLEYMRVAVGEVITLREAGGGGPVDSEISPLAALDQTFRQLGLAQPTSIIPVGQTGARIQFSDVEAEQLIRALGEVDKRYGLRISQLNMTRRQPGLVSARVTVER